jgi:hypothetical protein
MFAVLTSLLQANTYGHTAKYLNIIVVVIIIIIIIVTTTIIIPRSRLF